MIKKFEEMNYSKPTIYVDLDGVLCDFMTAAKNLPEMKYPQSKIGFFRDLDEIPNAISSFKKLEKEYDVCVLTRPSFKNINCFTEKAEWILNNLGYKALEKSIFSGDKSRLIGDYLIDDGDNANQDKFNGKLIKFGSEEFPDWNSIMIYFGI